MSSQTIDLIYNITGIIGISLMIGTYFLLNIGKIRSDQMVYPALNLLGAILHLASLNRFYNLPSVIIELFWIGISIYGIYKISKTAKSAEKHG